MAGGKVKRPQAATFTTEFTHPTFTDLRENKRLRVNK
jgi:hypothetical protein